MAEKTFQGCRAAAVRLATAVLLGLPALAACAPATVQGPPGASCPDVMRRLMIVQVVSASADEMVRVRDMVLTDVFGEAGYRRSRDVAACGPLLHETFTSIPAFAIELTEDEAGRLRAHSAVSSVTPDRVSAPAANPQ